MRFLRCFVALLVLLAGALGASPARAAATFSPALPDPEWQGRPTADLQENEIGKNDCLASKAEVSFDFTVTGFTDGNMLEVWAGVATCDQKMTRSDSENDCKRIVDAQKVTTTTKVTVKAHDLVQRIPADTTAEDCTSGSDDATTRYLFFLVMDQSTNEAVGVAKWEYQFDLVPPAAPTSVVASSGENSLLLDFTAPTDIENGHYRYYCTPTEGAEGECSTTKFSEDQEPPKDAALSCGRESSAFSESGTTDDKLENGVTYVVAVAAEDAYGNVGKLSNVSCASPAAVTGFYEAYRAAGGQAGGGFCSFAPARRAAGPTALALLIGAAALLRRRR